ncbi:MAG: hypothetical protein NC240_03195 [Clostridium sp.]|nr:hypothetical protein [Clostridium sp.]
MVEDTLEVEANPVQINATNFPDENFRKYIKENFDKNNDDIVDDIGNITDMYVVEREIYSLRGIEFFGALINLSCSHNNLTSLDLSKNTSLKYLNCFNNPLMSLDLSKNTSLEELDCGCCSLTSLDVSKNMSLEEINCEYTNLTSLNLGENTSLTVLVCRRSQLTSLDVSKNTSLTYLDCHNNQLTNLNIGDNTSLWMLDCHNNQLTSLDVSKSTSLKYLDIDCNITTDISDLNVKSLAIFVPKLKGSIDLSNIMGIEKYMSGSGWNESTKKLTYELELHDGGAKYTISSGINGGTYLMWDSDYFAIYQGCYFYRDSYGDVRCISNGNLVIDEFKCDGTYTYYFQADGTAMRNRLTYHPDGKHVIYFDEDGHEVFSNFHHVEKSIAGDAVDDLCFFDVYGYMYVDVMTYDQAGEKLYYVNPYGVIEQNKWFEFSDTCVWAGTTNKVGKGYGYANADGTLMVNTYTYDWRGNFVYLQGDGHMR